MHFFFTSVPEKALLSKNFPPKTFAINGSSSKLYRTQYLGTQAVTSKTRLPLCKCLAGQGGPQTPDPRPCRLTSPQRSLFRPRSFATPSSITACRTPPNDTTGWKHACSPSFIQRHSFGASHHFDQPALAANWGKSYRAHLAHLRQRESWPSKPSCCP